MYNHDFAWDDVKMLDHESNSYKRRTYETESYRYAINKKTDISNLNDVYG